MEWVLVLIMAFTDSQVGQAVATATISGHKSKQACLASLENAKNERIAQGFTKQQAELTFHRSFCVQKG